MRRVSLASLVAAAAAAMVVPSSTSAAVTIGDTFPPTGSCAFSQTRLQSVSGGQYSAPTNGVITSWSFEAASNEPDNLRFKVGRATGTADEFTIVGESTPLANITPSALNSFSTRIPVMAGDVIGLFNDGSGDCTQSSVGSTYHSFSADLHPGDTQLFSENTDVRLDISATLEGDCDKDGLGDETQDADLSSCPPAVCKGQQATIRGTAGNDEITGTPDRDVIAASAGKDKVSGLAGKDLICGGAGRDTLKGGKAKDKLYGQKGRDKLRGGGGKDRCVGGKKNDSAKKCEVEKST